jgi:hypothetical protein
LAAQQFGVSWDLFGATRCAEQKGFDLIHHIDTLYSDKIRIENPIARAPAKIRKSRRACAG